VLGMFRKFFILLLFVKANIFSNANPEFVIIHRKIFLLFSAYQSPIILMRSGIGSEKHLAEVDIDCKVDLRGVGENLLDHVIVRIFIVLLQKLNLVFKAYASYQVNEPSLTLNSLFYHPGALALSIKNWQDTKIGVMANVAVGCYVFARVDQRIQDPLWEAAKQKQQSNDSCDCDPAGQWPNQPHIEFTTTELFMGAPHIRNTGQFPKTELV
jgi:hypothetical protein